MGIEEYSKKKYKERSKPKFGDAIWGVPVPGSGIASLASGIKNYVSDRFFKEKPERVGVDLYSQSNKDRNYISPSMNVIESIYPEASRWLDPVNKAIVNWGTETVPESFKKWHRSYETGSPVAGDTERDWKRQIGDMWKVPVNALGYAAQGIQEATRSIPRLAGLDVETEALWDDPERPPKHAAWYNPLGIHFDPSEHSGTGATGYYLDAITQGWWPGYNENPLRDPKLSEDILDKWVDKGWDWEEGHISDLMTQAAEDDLWKKSEKELDPEKWARDNPQGDRTYEQWNNAYRDDLSTIFTDKVSDRYGKQVSEYVMKEYEREMMDKYGFHMSDDVMTEFGLPYSDEFSFGAYDPLVELFANWEDRGLLKYSDPENAGFLQGLDTIGDAIATMGIPAAARYSLKNSPKMLNYLSQISPALIGQGSKNIGLTRKLGGQYLVSPAGLELLDQYLNMRQEGP